MNVQCVRDESTKEVPLINKSPFITNSFAPILAINRSNEQSVVAVFPERITSIA